MHAYIFTPCREVWAGASRQRASAAGAGARSARTAAARCQGQADYHRADAVAGQEPAGRADDLVPGPADADRRSAGGGRRLDRATRGDLLQSVSAAAAQARRRGAGRPWLDHIKSIYAEDDAAHIVRWLAHRVQRPAEKINHALVLGGAQGIGKDTLLEPVKHAVGPWNFQDVSPTHLLGRFNGFVKSVILRVNEARDLGDVDRFSFYDHTKIYTAAPPDVLRVDEKHLREYYVFNCLGFIVTTNHKTDGIYLPADDRRHYVAWSQRTKEEFSTAILERAVGLVPGRRHMGTSPPIWPNLICPASTPRRHRRRPPAFWDIVNANNAPEDAELADVLDALGNPDAVTLRQLIERAIGTEAADWLTDRRNRRAIPHRMERCGYVPVRNPYADDGLWKFQDRRQVVYAKARLSLRDQIVAVRKLL